MSAGTPPPPDPACDRSQRALGTATGHRVHKHPVQGRSPVETSSLDSLKVHRLGYAASGRPPANQQTGALWGGGGEPAAENGRWKGPAATPMSACSVSGACTPPQPPWSPPAGAVPSACARPSPTAVCWPGLWLGMRRYLWRPPWLPVPWLSSERGDTTQSRHVGAGWRWDRMTGTLCICRAQEALDVRLHLRHQQRKAHENPSAHPPKFLV